MLELNILCLSVSLQLMQTEMPLVLFFEDIQGEWTTVLTNYETEETK